MKNTIDSESGRLNADSVISEFATLEELVYWDVNDFTDILPARDASCAYMHAETISYC